MCVCVYLYVYFKIDNQNKRIPSVNRQANEMLNNENLVNYGYFFNSPIVSILLTYIYSFNPLPYHNQVS